MAAVLAALGLCAAVLPEVAQPHLFATPAPPHQVGATHVSPQSSVEPHALITPQTVPGDPHVAAAHPHRLGVPPPPHVCCPEHTPQLSCTPQPLSIVPQFAFCCAQLRGTHPSLGGPASGGRVARQRLYADVCELHRELVADSLTCPVGRHTACAMRQSFIALYCVPQTGSASAVLHASVSAKVGIGDCKQA
jgi:hypothetical protein